MKCRRCRVGMLTTDEWPEQTRLECPRCGDVAAIYYERESMAFLVLLACELDDVPLRLFSRYEAAKEFAESLWDESKLLAEIAEAEIDWPCNISDPACVYVVSFADSGERIGMRMIDLSKGE